MRDELLDDPEETGRTLDRVRARGGTFSFAFLLSALGFGIIFTLATAIDVARTSHASLFRLLLSGGQNSGDSLLYIAQIVAALLGIALTVVAIVVQLAANRYTAKIIDLFIRDPVNVPTLALFVVSALEALWVAHLYQPGFVPRTGVFVTEVLATASILVLVPYFRHVFKFLEPRNVIRRIRNEILEQIERATRIGDEARTGVLQLRVVQSLDHLKDIARNSVQQLDRSLAIGAIVSLRDVALGAARLKARLPAAWFRISNIVRKNPDFLNFPEASIRVFEAERSWLERKIAWQLFVIFQGAVGSMRGVCSALALTARELGEEALFRGDRENLRLAARTFNTFLRAALNGRDVRTAFNVLLQYRLFAEALVRARDIELSREVFRHFRYYGRTADRMGLGFVLETAAHDLSVLVKEMLAAGADEAIVREHLFTVLALDDDEPETPLATSTRAGVRRAQIVLAAHLIARGREDLARLIFDDMRKETPARLQAVKSEILSAEPEFFELTERVSSFGYVPPEERAALETFFEWFSERREAVEARPR